MSVFDKLKLDTLWRIVSQVNVDEISDTVTHPFHMLVIAQQEEDASTLAALLSDEKAAFIHPWLTATTPSAVASVQAKERSDLAILLSDQVELTARMQDSYRTLAAARVPTLIIVGGRAADAPDAGLPRRGEEARRIAVPILNAAAMRTGVAEAIIGMVPSELRLALPRRLPPLRTAAFQHLIQETAQANATYSFSTGLAEIIPILDIPLNMGDLIVLTKNQLVMAYKIAVIAGKQGTPQQLFGEIIGVLGGSFIFRQLARQLVGVVPVWGLVPKVAVAYAGTWTIGQAVTVWAVEGQQITPDLLRQYFDESLARGQIAAQRLVEGVRARLPGKANTKITAAPPAPPSTAEPLWQRLRRRLPPNRRD